MAGLVLAVSSAVRAQTIDCANSSWDTGTGVVSLKITGLTQGTKVIVSVYDDDTCSIRTSVETSPADVNGDVVVAIDTLGMAVIGDKVVTSHAGCAVLNAAGVVGCAAACPTCQPPAAIDCTGSSWDDVTGVVSLTIKGLTEGDTVIASVYNDNTCTIRTSVQSGPADVNGTVVVAIDTLVTAAVGDKIVTSRAGCAVLNAAGVVGCGATCPVCTFGACCINDSAECVDIDVPACAKLQGVPHADSTCAEVFVDGNCIPAITTWGLLVMALLVVSAGTVVARRRARQTA